MRHAVPASQVVSHLRHPRRMNNRKRQKVTRLKIKNLLKRKRKRKRKRKMKRNLKRNLKRKMPLLSLQLKTTSLKTKSPKMMI